MPIQLFTVKPDETITECRLLDTMYWGSVVHGIKGIKRVMPRRVDKVMGTDLFLSLYHWNPVFKGEDTPDAALTAYMQRLVDTPQFKKLRSKTVGDKHRAAAGAVRLFRELMRKNKSDLKSLLEAKHARDTTEAMSSKDVYEIVKGELDRAEHGMAEYIKSKPFISKEYKQSSTISKPNYFFNSNHPDYEGNSTVGALDTVDADMDAASELSDFHPPGKGYSLDPDSRGQRVMDTLLDEALVGKISSQDKLRSILKIAGRMRMILEGAKSKKPVPAPSSSNIKFGNDLERVLASELALLGDDELEDLFYLKYHEASLLTRDRKDKIQQGQGPFIGCVDFSGSMSGMPEQYALALFTSMARMAIKKKRKIVFIPFASNSHQGVEIKDAAGLIDTFTRSFDRLGNGTNFENPLSSAIGHIRFSKEFKKADILFITDGISNLTPRFVDEFTKDKKDLDFRLFGFNVMHDQWPENMKPLFDATSKMGKGGELTQLDWLDKVSGSLV